MRLPWHRFLNYVYAWCLKYIPAEGREEFDKMLNDPLPGRARAKPTQEELEAEGAGFLALMQSQGKM